MSKWTEKTHILTRLTLIAGEPPTSWSDDMIAWANQDGEYWLRLLDMNGDGEHLLIHIEEDDADEMKLYAVMGMVLYHEINYSNTPWKEFIEAEEESNHDS